MYKQISIFAIIAAGATLPAAAFAQDTVCAGVPEGRWVAESAEASDVSATQAPFDMTTFVPAGGGSAVAQFTLSSPQTVRYEAKGAFGGDPIASLYNTSGGEMSNNDDGAVDYGVRAEVDLPEGTYCLKVSDVQGGLLPVEIRIGRAEHEALQESVDEMTYSEAGRCEDAEGQIEADLSNGEFRQSVSVVRDVAVWFSLSEAASLTLEGIGNQNDPLLYLQRGDGELIAENDDHTGLDARIDVFNPLEPGRYCVAVATYEEDGSNVEVAIRTLDAEEVARSQIESGAMSPLPGGDYPIEHIGELHGRLIHEAAIDQDYLWLSFDITEPSLARIDALAVGDSDPQIAIFDDAGREIMRNDDVSGGDYSARIAEELNPGTYVLGVNSVNGSTERTRIVIDQFIRVR